MIVPTYSTDLISKLKEIYPDTYQVEYVSFKDYWKMAGVIELIRLLESSIENNINKEF